MTLFHYVLGVLAIASICITALVCAVAFLKWLLRFLTEVRSWDGADWKEFIFRTCKVLLLVVAGVLLLFLLVPVIGALSRAWDTPGGFLVGAGVLLFALLYGFVGGAVEHARKELRESTSPRWKCILLGVGRALFDLTFFLVLLSLWLTCLWFQDTY